MKIFKFLLAGAFSMLVSMSAFAQNNIAFNAKVQVLNVVQPGPLGGDYQISGFFSDDLSLFTSVNITEDSTRFMDAAGNIYVVDIVSTHGTSVVFEVDVLDNNVTPVTGVAKLFDPTPKSKFPTGMVSQTDLQNTATDHIFKVLLDQVLQTAKVLLKQPGSKYSGLVQEGDSLGLAPWLGGDLDDNFLRADHKIPVYNYLDSLPKFVPINKLRNSIDYQRVSNNVGGSTVAYVMGEDDVLIHCTGSAVNGVIQLYLDTISTGVVNATRHVNIVNDFGQSGATIEIFYKGTLLETLDNQTTSAYAFSSGTSDTWSISTYSQQSLQDEVLTEATANVTAEKFKILPVNSTGGVIAVNPPLSPDEGDWFKVSDSRAMGDVNNITIDFINATTNLHGSSQNYIINSKAAIVKFTYVNATVGYIISE